MAMGVDGKRMDFGEAFFVEGSATNPNNAAAEEGMRLEPYRHTPTRMSGESSYPQPPPMMGNAEHPQGLR
jgi:hypothetical protein